MSGPRLIRESRGNTHRLLDVRSIHLPKYVVTLQTQYIN